MYRKFVVRCTYVRRVLRKNLTYLEEAIEEYTTYDVLSYADQVK